MPTSYLKGLDREVLDYMRSVPREILNCRARGHNWDPTHDGYIVQQEGSHVGCLTERLQCSRCLSDAVDFFDRATLERVGLREYAYVDGYLQHGLAIPRTVVRRFLAQLAREALPERQQARKIATRGADKSHAAARAA
ncbi:hypothetical protein ACIQUM_31760 [Amycolatopsis azurea]|uniref:hypothetical protein n=1 Tax=Amycolatopsis azurea TaxID=36819 RepID=UPI003800731F